MERKGNTGQTGLLALVAAGMAHPALGTTTQFDDRASFESLVAGLTHINFETTHGFADAPAAVAGFAGVLSTSTGGPAFLYEDSPTNQALTGSSGSPAVADAFRPITLTFPVPRLAVGFDALDLTANDEVVLLVVQFDGELEDLVFSRTDPVGLSNPFLGVISTDPIRSVVIYSADLGESQPGTRANLIDNLALGPEVPAAPPAVLLAGALFTLARRRRAPRA